MADDTGEQEVIRRIRAALERHGEAALAGAPAETAAYRWAARGFADAEDVEAWLAARCFDPAQAESLEEAGFTPEQAALRTTAGRGGYEDTVAHKLARGDLTLEEARRLVTSDFWNG
ncbi:MAG: hypothetical protein LC800_20155 [Acidobacteria bacterium]|nr:hypothetical protein [Acidobacteriota bacterium]